MTSTNPTNPTARKAPTTTMKKLTLTIAALVIAVTGCTAASDDTASTTTAKPAATAEATTTEAPATTAAPTTTEAPTTTDAPTTTTEAPPSLDDQMGQWALDHADSIDDVTAALGYTSEQTTPTGMGMACDELAVAVADAQQAPPVPDPNVDRFYQEALSEFATGADLCSTGLATGDYGMVDEAAGHIENGSAAIAEAGEAMQDYL